MENQGIEIRVSEIEFILGYEFKNTDFIKTAIVHPGSSPDFPSKSFEKMEFLGDRVLGLSLADALYHHFSDEKEGELALRIATLAGTDFLIELAKKTKLLDFFIIPKDFYISSHKNSSSIADMMEAVFGAIFLDSNFETAQKVVLKIYANDIEKVIYKRKDSKTRLQEISQAQSAKLPEYRLLKIVGEAHNPVFEIEVTACGKKAVGHGNSKKSAEHDAAENLLKQLDHKKNNLVQSNDK